MHVEEDGGKSSMEKGPTKSFCQPKEQNSIFDMIQQSSKYRARAKSKIYRFQSNRGAQVVQVQPKGLST